MLSLIKPVFAETGLKIQKTVSRHSSKEEVHDEKTTYREKVSPSYLTPGRRPSNLLLVTTTTLSSKGQVVLPQMVRSKLHLAPGAKLLCEIQGDSVVLTPEHPRRLVREYVIDPLTGLRVTKALHKTDPVTTETIKALLEDYP